LVALKRRPFLREELFLTLDQTIQYIAEQELAEQVGKSKHWRNSHRDGTYSGEILAMASVPTYNPNFYAKYPREYWKNRSILSIYEPGSTFKIITAGSCVRRNLAQPDETINCMNGSIVVGKYRIRDHKSYGLLTVREIVAYSSNIGAVQLGFRVGKERFDDTSDHLGLDPLRISSFRGSQRTCFHPSSEWPAVTLANISMGQGIGVTPFTTGVCCFSDRQWRIPCQAKNHSETTIK